MSESNNGDTVAMDDRKLKERAFGDQRMRDRENLSEENFSKRYANRRFYSISRKSNEYLARLYSDNVKGKLALNYCCGTGVVSVPLAKAGAQVFGIDISPGSVAAAKATVEEAGLGDSCEHMVMDAENMDFPDSHFDIIVCSGVLHHLDLTKAFPELCRVLKPGGRIICSEPLKFNPLIQLYRRLTPDIRTSWEIDHILGLKEFRLAKQYFRMDKVRCFNLLTIMAVPLRKFGIFEYVLAILEALDRVVLSIPAVRLIAWVIIFELTDPKKDASPSSTGNSKLN